MCSARGTSSCSRRRGWRPPICSWHWRAATTRSARACSGAGCGSGTSSWSLPTRGRRGLTRQIHGLESLAAISDSTINERGAARAVTAVVSLRLLVIASAYSALVPEGRRRVIAHELTHAALAGSTSGRTPAWLVEGVAMYVSGDRRPAPPDGDLAALSKPASIARLSGARQAAAYAASSAAAFAIVDRFGPRRLLALYDAFNDPALAGEPGRRLVDRALRRELGVSLNDLATTPRAE
jgi:hypothetical protein